MLTVCSFSKALNITTHVLKKGGTFVAKVRKLIDMFHCNNDFELLTLLV